MVRLYVFLLDFLIPFLCDPDLQCGSGLGSFSLHQVMQPLHGIHTVPSMAPFYTSTHASIESFHGPPWIHFYPSQLLNFNFDTDPPFSYAYCVPIWIRLFILMRIFKKIRNPKIMRSGSSTLHAINTKHQMIISPSF